MKDRQRHRKREERERKWERETTTMQVRWNEVEEEIEEKRRIDRNR